MRALRRRKVREREGRFIAEGIRQAEDLIGSGLAIEWALMSSSLEEDERGRALMARVRDLGIAFHVVSPAEFSRCAATETPQGVLMVAEIPHAQLDDLVTGAGQRAVLLLDAVQDPGNLGTLVRSAEALGASGVVALPGTVDPWNAKSVRAAAGSSFRVPIVAAGWTDAARRLRGAGYTILAGAIGGEPVVPIPGPIALVVGNEGAGVSRGIIAQVDRVVGIPLRGRAESLNVTAATAILLHELTR